jgi:proteasome lid subunit RPN8/RPN11
MYYIKRTTAESIIMAAKNVYPKEFFSMLGGKNKTIDELVIVPAIFGNDSVIYEPEYVPIMDRIIGTVHSHPTKNNEPSNEDIQSFRKTGKIHIIISYPYNLNTMKAFDNNGKQVKLEVIE